MSFLNLNLKPETFGLDISDLSLKIIKLKKRGKFFELASFGEEKNKPGIIKNGEIKDKKELIRIIKKATSEVKGEKLKTKYVVASLPEEKAFLKVIQMPKMAEDDLKSAIIYEVEQHIPLSLEKVYLDFQVIPSVHDNLDHLDVLIAALPKETVDSYTFCLKEANLKPLFLEVESLAICRALIKDEITTYPVLLIDLGETKTGFIIFSGHSLRFTSSIPVSSQNFTEIISKALKTNLTESEKLKLKYGLREKKVFDGLIPALTDLIEQIKKYINYYQTHTSYDKQNIKKVFLCGGGAKLKGLKEILSSQLKVSVEIGNPWINIFSPTFQPKKGTLIYEKEGSLSYTTSLGLALRGIKNL